MNNLKKLFFTTILISLFSTNVYANNLVDTGSINALSEANNTAVELNHSDLNVKVIKTIGSTTEVIYTGPLSGYKNGVWNNVDFSKTRFLLVFDWDSEETVYIVPDENEVSLPSSVDNITEEAIPNSTQDSTFHISNNDKMEVQLNMVYGDGYYEGKLLNGQTLNIPIEITNNGNASAELICYMAEYDSSGRLIDLTQSAFITVPAAQTIKAAAEKEINANTHTAKIFLWENNTLKPVIRYIELQGQNVDYYSDTMENAQACDITKKINGKIDTLTDVDFIKFTPQQTGDYLIWEQSASALDCALYNSSGSTIANAVSLGTNKYIKCALSANEEYYIKVNGNANSEYALTIKQAENTASISAANNGILYMGNIAENNTEISLYSAGGTLIDKKTVASGNNVSCVLNDDSLATEYVVKVETPDNKVDIYKVHLIKNETNHSVQAQEYLSIPIVVKNIETLHNTNFSVIYDPVKLSVADISDLTKAVEVGIGSISGAQIHTFYVNNGSVHFRSTRAIDSAWSGVVNSIKLRANTGGDVVVTTVICTVE